MDEKDEALIRVLERKAGLSSRTLSSMTGLPISTVHRRIQKLERSGVILGYKALIDHEKTTRPIGVLLLVNLAETTPGKGHIPKKDTLNNLRTFEENEEIIEVQGFGFDLVIRARTQSLKKMSAFIEELRSIEGVEELSSAIITDETTMPPPTYLRKSAP